MNPTERHVIEAGTEAFVVLTAPTAALQPIEMAESPLEPAWPEGVELVERPWWAARGSDYRGPQSGSGRRVQCAPWLGQTRPRRQTGSSRNSTRTMVLVERGLMGIEVPRERDGNVVDRCIYTAISEADMLLDSRSSTTLGTISVQWARVCKPHVGRVRAFRGQGRRDRLHVRGW